MKTFTLSWKNIYYLHFFHQKPYLRALSVSIKTPYGQPVRPLTKKI